MRRTIIAAAVMGLTAPACLSQAPTQSQATASTGTPSPSPSASPSPDPCSDAHDFLAATLGRIEGDTHDDRLDTVAAGDTRVLRAARRAGLIVGEAETCFTLDQRVEATELVDAAAAEEEAPDDEPEEAAAPAAAPPPPPAKPQGELVLAWWGEQRGGGSANGTACTSVGFRFRNASDTPVHTVTVKFNSSWGWIQSSEEADDGVARTFFEDGRPVTETHTLGVAAYDDVSFRWEICTPDQYDEVYPGWRGRPFGFSARPLEFSWTWAG